MVKSGCSEIVTLFVLFISLAFTNGYMYGMTHVNPAIIQKGNQDGLTDTKLWRLDTTGDQDKQRDIIDQHLSTLYQNNPGSSMGDRVPDIKTVENIDFQIDDNESMGVIRSPEAVVSYLKNGMRRSSEPRTVHMMSFLPQIKRNAAMRDSLPPLLQYKDSTTGDLDVYPDIEDPLGHIYSEEPPDTEGDRPWGETYHFAAKKSSSAPRNSKRWWGSYYRPRPKMDRRAVQSKHYGCLKTCIGVGILHPIQCHTLC